MIQKGQAWRLAGAAAFGAATGFGCLLQLVIPAILLLVGLWILSKMFGG
jgi:hypothetical protein